MKFVLLIFNIKSNTNFGQLIRTANAFGAVEICFIGRKKFSSYGSQGTTSATNFRHFYQVNDAIAYYKELNYDFVGIEISKASISINEKEFENDTVFVLGNEGAGISEAILNKCDYCVYIPQFGSGASINVNAACGIVFNSFTKNRNDHNNIDGFKFEKSSIKDDPAG
jgi:tRNA G18 (ribose-2'-O)-methylase SpoU